MNTNEYKWPGYFVTAPKPYNKYWLGLKKRVDEFILLIWKEEL
jgi:hypothetical protein